MLCTRTTRHVTRIQRIMYYHTEVDDKRNTSNKQTHCKYITNRNSAYTTLQCWNQKKRGTYEYGVEVNYSTLARNVSSYLTVLTGLSFLRLILGNRLTSQCHGLGIRLSSLGCRRLDRLLRRFDCLLARATVLHIFFMGRRTVVGIFSFHFVYLFFEEAGGGGVGEITRMRKRCSNEE